MPYALEIIRCTRIASAAKSTQLRWRNHEKWTQRGTLNAPLCSAIRGVANTAGAVRLQVE